MEIVGTIKKIGEVQEITDKFKKREVILTTDEEQYPQTLCIECTQERTEITNGFKEGDKVKININLRGREWVNPEGVTKYFNTIQGWRIEKIGSSTSFKGESNFNYPDSKGASASYDKEEYNDLPF